MSEKWALSSASRTFCLSTATITHQRSYRCTVFHAHSPGRAASLEAPLTTLELVLFDMTGMDRGVCRMEYSKNASKEIVLLLVMTKRVLVMWRRTGCSLLDFVGF